SAGRKFGLIRYPLAIVRTRPAVSSLRCAKKLRKTGRSENTRLRIERARFTVTKLELPRARISLTSVAGSCQAGSSRRRHGGPPGVEGFSVAIAKLIASTEEFTPIVTIPTRGPLPRFASRN